jgi:hypothetical protein
MGCNGYMGADVLALGRRMQLRNILALVHLHQWQPLLPGSPRPALAGMAGPLHPIGQQALTCLSLARFLGAPNQRFAVVGLETLFSQVRYHVDLGNRGFHSTRKTPTAIATMAPGPLVTIFFITIRLFTVRFF